ncbi:MAG: DUF3575 domain-containing protein [Bacteroidales bacterium]
MKKATLFAVLGLLLSTGLMAQKKSNIKTDLLSPIIRTYVLKFETAISENSSIQVGALYTNFLLGSDAGDFSGFAVTPEFRYYLSETPAPNGTYIAPNVRYMKHTVTDLNGDTGSLSSLGFGLNLGKQLVAKDIFVVDAWFGPTYNVRTL